MRIFNSTGEKLYQGWVLRFCAKEIFWTDASLKDAGQLTFAAAKMGAEMIPGLLASIRKATSASKEYSKGR